MRGGTKSKNKADGKIESIVSSKRSVKSNVTLPGNSMKGPKLLSSTVTLELMVLDARSTKPKYVFMVSKQVLLRGGETIQNAGLELNTDGTLWQPGHESRHVEAIEATMYLEVRAVPRSGILIIRNSGPRYRGCGNSYAEKTLNPCHILA
jgi:hypothetical protein